MKHPSKLHWQLVAQSGHGLRAPTSQTSGNNHMASPKSKGKNEQSKNYHPMSLGPHAIFRAETWVSARVRTCPSQRSWYWQGGPLGSAGAPPHVLSTPVSSPVGQSQEFVFSKVIIPRPAHLLLSPFTNFSSTLGSPRTNCFCPQDLPGDGWEQHNYLSSQN